MFGSESVRGERTGTYGVGKNVEFVLVIENSQSFRRNQWGRWNSRARRVDDQGLRRDRDRWEEEHKGKDEVPWGDSGRKGR